MEYQDAQVFVRREEYPQGLWGPESFRKLKLVVTHGEGAQVYVNLQA